MGGKTDAGHLKPIVNLFYTSKGKHLLCRDYLGKWLFTIKKIQFMS